MFSIWPAEIQGKFENLCWACSLSWWSRIASGREYHTVDDLIHMYEDHVDWNNSGGALPSSMATIWGASRWKTTIMRGQRLSMTKLYKYTAGDFGIPILVAYYDRRISGLHANVVWTEKHANFVYAMDPNDGYVRRDVEFYRSDKVTNLIAIPNEVA